MANVSPWRRCPTCSSPSCRPNGSFVSSRCCASSSTITWETIFYTPKKRKTVIWPYLFNYVGIIDPSSLIGSRLSGRVQLSWPFFLRMGSWPGLCFYLLTKWTLNVLCRSCQRWIFYNRLTSTSFRKCKFIMWRAPSSDVLANYHYIIMVAAYLFSKMIVNYTFLRPWAFVITKEMFVCVFHGGGGVARVLFFPQFRKCAIFLFYILKQTSWWTTAPQCLDNCWKEFCRLFGARGTFKKKFPVDNLKGISFPQHSCTFCS